MLPFQSRNKYLMKPAMMPTCVVLVSSIVFCWFSESDWLSFLTKMNEAWQPKRDWLPFHFCHASFSVEPGVQISLSSTVNIHPSVNPGIWDPKRYEPSHEIWYFSSSVNSFFKWVYRAKCEYFGRTRHLQVTLFISKSRGPDKILRVISKLR